MTKRTLILTALAALTFPAAATAADTSHEFEARGECRKRTTLGCTANEYPVFSAPEGKFIVPASIATGNVSNSLGMRPECYKPEVVAYTDVAVAELNTVVPLPVSIRAHVQVQSGSGLRDINKVFFVNCRYDVILRDIPG